MATNRGGTVFCEKTAVINCILSSIEEFPENEGQNNMVKMNINISETMIPK